MNVQAITTKFTTCLNNLSGHCDKYKTEGKVELERHCVAMLQVFQQLETDLEAVTHIALAAFSVLAANFPGEWVIDTEEDQETTSFYVSKGGQQLGSMMISNLDGPNTILSGFCVSFSKEAVTAALGQPPTESQKS